LDLLKKYIIALTNLYGMLHKEKAVVIYNSQNDDKIGIDDVEAYLASPPKELEDAFIYTHKDYFVHEAILEFDEFEQMLRKKADKPYYVPEKEELLKYTDEWYFEKNSQYEALLNYVKNHFFKGDAEKAERLCEDIHAYCQFGSNIQGIINCFNSKRISFKNEQQLNEVLQLAMDFYNNMRIWENNGHTPHEIFEKFEKPHLRPLPKRPFDLNDTNMIDIKTRKKMGRNDPCPCGSGKKYKKCCLGKSDT